MKSRPQPERRQGTGGARGTRGPPPSQRGVEQSGNGAASVVTFVRDVIELSWGGEGARPREGGRGARPAWEGGGGGRSQGPFLKWGWEEET